MKPYQVTIHFRLAAKTQRILNEFGIHSTIDLSTAAKDDCCIFNIDIPEADIETLNFFLTPVIHGTRLRKSLAAYEAQSCISLRVENERLKQQIENMKKAAYEYLMKLQEYFQQRNDAIKQRLEEIKNRRTEESKQPVGKKYKYSKPSR